MNRKFNLNPFRGLVTAIFAFVALVLCNFNLVAQTSSVPVPPPASLPIYSQDALRSWAMSEIRRGSVDVYSPSMDWSFPGRVTYYEVEGTSGEDVLRKLSLAAFAFRLQNTNDLVRLTGRLADGIGREFFRGSIEVTAASFQNGAPMVQLWIQRLPVTKNAASAEILVTNEDGQTVKNREVEVDKAGGALLDPWLAGVINGILSVRYQNGQLVLYPLSRMGGISPVDYSGGSGAGVADHYIYKIMAGLNTIPIRAVGARPSLYIEALEDNAVIAFDVAGLVYGPNGQYWERPIHFFVQGPDGFLGLNDIAGGGFTLSKKGMSVRIFFEWDEFAQPGTIYTGPEQGEKGAIAVTPVTP